MFLAAEFFVIPGFGIAGLTGLLLMLASIVMASQHFLIPNTARQLATSMNSLVVLTASGVVFLIVAVALSHYLRILPVVRWLVLEPPTVADVADVAPARVAESRAIVSPDQHGGRGGRLGLVGRL